MSKSIKIPTKREKVRLENDIKSHRNNIDRFPELLEINSEQKAIDYRKDLNCRKCEYLKHSSPMEEIMEEIKKIHYISWKFYFFNKENSCYCCRNTGGGGTRMSMVEIENPEKSLCTSYQLSTEISPYLTLIQRKYRWERELIEFRKLEHIRIEEEKKIAIANYEREKERLKNIDKKETDNSEVKSHRYSERDKNGKFGKNHRNTVEENIL